MIDLKVRARIAELEAKERAWNAAFEKSKKGIPGGNGHYWIFDKPMDHNELMVLKLRVFDGKA